MAHLKGDGMAVRDRWISLIFGVATGARATRTLLTPIGVVIFGVFTSLFVLLAILVDGLLDGNGEPYVFRTSKIRSLRSPGELTLGIGLYKKADGEFLALIDSVQIVTVEE